MIPLVRASNLAIGYTARNKVKRTVSTGISLELYPEEFVCLVGPNGSGKSTLLRTLTGLQPSLQGDVLLSGRKVSSITPKERARHVSIVLTSPVQAGQLTVYDVASLGRYPYTDWIGSLTEEDHASIRRSLVSVGIESFSQRYLTELSDGERQKVMIARALTQNPRLLILDEPTAFLDLPYRIEIMQILRSIAREGDRGVLLSTHDLDLAMRTADRLWIIGRNGSFHSGAPEELVLNGVLSDVFAIRGVRFNDESGQFDLPARRCRHAVLSGEHGKARFWTSKALDRIGYSIMGEGKPEVEVSIISRNGTLAWKVLTETDLLQFETLTECIRWLRNRNDMAS